MHALGVLREHERTKLYFFNLGLAETAVLGAFMAQDLALFVVFFDLMLVPFYFLIGGWGTGDRVRATTSVIYTLAGSLLMLAARSRSACSPRRGRRDLVLARPLAALGPRGHAALDLPAVRARFFVKAPLFPLHGWVPETYRSTPIPVLALLSGVCPRSASTASCVVLPVMPEASQHFQDLFIVVAALDPLRSCGFSQDARLVLLSRRPARLHRAGDLRFDTRAPRARSSRCSTTAWRSSPLFLIIGVLAVRAGAARAASWAAWPSARRARGAVPGGGLATLAMPGSANFVGEILFLFGALEDKLVYGWWRAWRRARGRLHDPRVPALDAQSRGARGRVA